MSEKPRECPNPSNGQCLYPQPDEEGQYTDCETCPHRPTEDRLEAMLDAAHKIRKDQAETNAALRQRVRELEGENGRLVKAIKTACEQIECVTGTCPNDTYEWEHPRNCADVCGTCSLAECWAAYFAALAAQEGKGRDMAKATATIKIGDLPEIQKKLEDAAETITDLKRQLAEAEGKVKDAYFEGYIEGYGDDSVDPFTIESAWECSKTKEALATPPQQAADE